MDQKITVTPQGPYVVTGELLLRRKRAVVTSSGEPVAWVSDAPLESEASYALCRCGASQNKPFCDGSHARHDWDGTTTAASPGYDDRAVDYPGDGIVMRDARELCEHAGFCATKLTNVWKMAPATGDTAVRSQLIAMIERCPSGALTHRVHVDGPAVEPDLASGIGVVDDGPLFVTGGVQVVGPDGATMEVRNRVTLCRCGASKNKPLCDGSHIANGFSDRPTTAQ
ncbi:MAG: CDGSH iron-sulfur domain-containing protein [Mycobacteriales bacterium]